MNSSSDPAIGIPGSMSFEEFDLQKIKGIQVSRAISNGSRKRRVIS
jgi:hypothetical protein